MLTVTWFLLMCNGYREMVCLQPQPYASKRECQFIAENYHNMVSRSDDTIKTITRCVSITRKEPKR